MLHKERYNFAPGGANHNLTHPVYNIFKGGLRPISLLILKTFFFESKLQTLNLESLYNCNPIS